MLFHSLMKLTAIFETFTVTRSPVFHIIRHFNLLKNSFLTIFQIYTYFHKILSLLKTLATNHIKVPFTKQIVTKLFLVTCVTTNISAYNFFS